MARAKDVRHGSGDHEHSFEHWRAKVDAAGSFALLVAAPQGHHVYIELEHELHEGSALFLCGRTLRPSSVGALVTFNP